MRRREPRGLKTARLCAAVGRTCNTAASGAPDSSACPQLKFFPRLTLRREALHPSSPAHPLHLTNATHRAASDGPPAPLTTHVPPAHSREPVARKCHRLLVFSRATRRC